MSGSTARELHAARGLLDRVLVIGFGALLLAPSLDEWLRSAEARGPRRTELREPARFPELALDGAALRGLPRAFEAWHSDHLGLRDHLLRSKGRLALSVFGVSSTPIVELGRDGWMFFTGDRSRDVHRGRWPMTEAELDAWKSLLDERARYAAEQDFEHLFVLGPNKETIYPERVPRSWTRIGATRLEQVLARLERPDAANARMLDLRPALQAERERDLEADGTTPGDHVHHEYGTHWNGRGDVAACREILARLAERVAGLAPLETGTLDRRDRGHHGDTWGRAMYVDDLYPQKSYTFVGKRVESARTTELGVRVWTSTGPDPAAPRAVLFHDSFGESLRELLAPHFSRLVCHWRAGIDEDVVAREAPDVVIELYVERVLATHRADDLRLDGGDGARAAFEASEVRALLLDDANAPALLAGREGARVVFQHGDALAAVHFAGPASHVRVAPLELASPDDLLVRLEIESPVATELLLLPVWTGETSPRRRQSAAARVAPGRNVLHLRLPRTSKLEGFAFRAGASGSDYRIFALEVRLGGSNGAGTAPAARKE